MLLHQPHEPTEFVLPEATIGHEHHGIEPELDDRSFPCHMDVRWFSTIGTEENKIVRSIPKHGGHKVVYLARVFLFSRRTFYTEKSERATKAER